MSDMKYAKDVDFSFFKMGFWATIILAILKLSNIIDVSNFVVFLPLIIAVGGFVFIVFLIGLITLYFINKELDNVNEDSNQEQQDA